MEKKTAPSLAADSIPPCVSSADSDRRRLVRAAVGSGVLFLVAVLFGLVLSRPTDFESKTDYALAASATGVLRGEDVYLPQDKAIPTDMAPSAAPSVTDTTKTQAAQQNSSTETSTAPSPAEAHAVHDSYCNLYAQAVTGNVTPEQAARREQANGAIMGAIGGALLGAMFGGSGEHPGRSTALGASAGLAAGAAIGSSNAQLAADDIRKRYADAYSTCMAREDATGAAQSGS